MGSEIAPHNPLRVKQWQACRSRLLAKMQGLAEFTTKTVKEMLPDIKAVKDNRLWEYGGYESFEQFCNNAIGVTKQHVYKVLKDDETARKVLEIKEGESSYLTTPTVTPQAPKPEPEVQIEAPRKPAAKPVKQAKARVIGTEPNLPMHTEVLPNSANVCPHCGRPMP